MATTEVEKATKEPPARSLPCDDEGAAEVGGRHGVEHVRIEVGDRGRRQPSGAVHHDVHTAELAPYPVERGGDGVFVGDVGPERDRPAAGRGDRLHRVSWP